jgi:hypothetical protein
MSGYTSKVYIVQYDRSGAAQRPKEFHLTIGSGAEGSSPVHNWRMILSVTA